MGAFDPLQGETDLSRSWIEPFSVLFANASQFLWLPMNGKDILPDDRLGPAQRVIVENTWPKS